MVFRKSNIPYNSKNETYNKQTLDKNPTNILKIITIIVLTNGIQAPSPLPVGRQVWRGLG
jgi:hypothetical protein